MDPKTQELVQRLRGGSSNTYQRESMEMAATTIERLTSERDAAQAELVNAKAGLAALSKVFNNIAGIDAQEVIDAALAKQALQDMADEAQALGLYEEPATKDTGG